MSWANKFIKSSLLIVLVLGCSAKLPPQVIDAKYETIGIGQIRIYVAEFEPYNSFTYGTNSSKSVILKKSVVVTEFKPFEKLEYMDVFFPDNYVLEGEDIYIAGVLKNKDTLLHLKLSLITLLQQ